MGLIIITLCSILALLFIVFIISSCFWVYRKYSNYKLMYTEIPDFYHKPTLQRLFSFPFPFPLPSSLSLLPFTISLLFNVHFPSLPPFPPPFPFPFPSSLLP